MTCPHPIGGIISQYRAMGITSKQEYTAHTYAKCCLQCGAHDYHTGPTDQGTVTIINPIQVGAYA